MTGPANQHAARPAPPDPQPEPCWHRADFIGRLPLLLELLFLRRRHATGRVGATTGTGVCPASRRSRSWSMMFQFCCVICNSRFPRPAAPGRTRRTVSSRRRDRDEFAVVNDTRKRNQSTLIDLKSLRLMRRTSQARRSLIDCPDRSADRDHQGCSQEPQHDHVPLGRRQGQHELLYRRTYCWWLRHRPGPRPRPPGTAGWCA